LGVTDIELVAGSGGVFEIEVDGTLRYSKKSLGRFPTDDELNGLIAN
jgi:selT/selW/selH-like putative selenoprotein